MDMSTIITRPGSHRGLPVYSGDLLQATFPSLFSEKHTFITLPPTALGEFGPVKALIDSDHLHDVAQVAQSDTRKEIARIEEFLKLEHRIREDRSDALFLAEAFSSKRADLSAKFVTPETKSHYGKSDHNVLSRALTDAHPSLFAARNLEDGTMVTVNDRKGFLPNQEVVERFLGMVDNAEKNPDVAKKQSQMFQKMADLLDTAESEVQRLSGAEDGGAFKKFWKNRVEHRQLWVVLKDENGHPILDENHNVILTKTDPYSGGAAHTMKRTFSELTSFWGDSKVTDPGARAVCGVLAAGWMLLGKCGLQPMEDSRVRAGEAVHASDIEKLLKQRQVNEYAAMIDSESIQNPLGSLRKDLKDTGSAGDKPVFESLPMLPSHPEHSQGRG